LAIINVHASNIQVYPEQVLRIYTALPVATVQNQVATVHLYLLDAA
jgi:hypothetical protein